MPSPAAGSTGAEPLSCVNHTMPLKLSNAPFNRIDNRIDPGNISPARKNKKRRPICVESPQTYQEKECLTCIRAFTRHRGFLSHRKYAFGFFRKNVRFRVIFLFTLFVQTAHNWGSRVLRSDPAIRQAAGGGRRPRGAARSRAWGRRQGGILWISTRSRWRKKS